MEYTEEEREEEEVVSHPVPRLQLPHHNNLL